LAATSSGGSGGSEWLGLVGELASGFVSVDVTDGALLPPDPERGLC
jgi:hypothetical protein